MSNWIKGDTKIGRVPLKSCETPRTKMTKPVEEDGIRVSALFEGIDEEDLDEKVKHPLKLRTDKKYEVTWVWKNIIIFSFLHIGALYGVYLTFTSAKYATILFAIFLYQSTIFGVLAGAHRLWSHRSYKATWQLRLLLVILDTMAFQDPVITWARDHRMHHKYSETEADPHNSSRGFFFAHVGWLITRKHPMVKEKGKNQDISDLYADPMLRFQKKYYFALMPLMCFILPTVIPVYGWGESWTNAYFIPTVLRYILSVNAIWMINSVAHYFGNRPYDRFTNASDYPAASLVTLGEGWHNYHHAFPWDYKTSEYGEALNFTTAVINLFAKIGWAYDMKTVSDEMLQKRVRRTGDGSHKVWGAQAEEVTACLQKQD